VGDVVAVHIIARPHGNVDVVMPLGRAVEAAGKKSRG
jgi:microcompartment protein CcmL/EutN